MRLFQLRFKQALPITKEKAWDFLSNPHNLKSITPEHMDFKIINGAECGIYPGQIIQYAVSPFMGYNTKWVTEITHVVEGRYFVDEQRFGPYDMWHHKHFIKEIPVGIEMEDIIDYKLPYGLIGQFVHPFIIKNQLHRIFKYREEKLKEMFGSIDGYQNELNFKSF